MLHEGDRLVKPEDTLKQVDTKNLEGIVVLGLAPKGKINTLQMSSLTIEELTLLSAQLNAHIVCLLGSMKEI